MKNLAAASQLFRLTRARPAANLSLSSRSLAETAALGPRISTTSTAWVFPANTNDPRRRVPIASRPETTRAEARSLVDSVLFNDSIRDAMLAGLPTACSSPPTGPRPTSPTSRPMRVGSCCAAGWRRLKASIASRISMAARQALSRAGLLRAALAVQPFRQAGLATWLGGRDLPHRQRAVAATPPDQAPPCGHQPAKHLVVVVQQVVQLVAVEVLGQAGVAGDVGGQADAPKELLPCVRVDFNRHLLPDVPIP